MNHHPALPKFNRIAALLGLCLAAAVLGGCEPGAEEVALEGREAGGQPGTQPAPQSEPQPELEFVGNFAAGRLNEASGLQAGSGGAFYLHNDEGARLFISDATGRNLGAVEVAAKNRDWEDITRVPSEHGPLLVIGDIGDNHGARKQVSLYFLPEPAAAEPGSSTAAQLVTVRHRLRVTYPDGPRDAESLAYDPSSGMLLILSKRDQPPRLYGIPLDLALWKQELEAGFLGEVPAFRPPTRRDILSNPGRGLWVSQPTGMDISPDGQQAAVISYRSLYLFERRADESWIEAFQRAPEEIIGPPGTHDEAVGFSADGRSVFVTSEASPAPLYRLDLH
jgi:hypothetical protein